MSNTNLNHRSFRIAEDLWTHYGNVATEQGFDRAADIRAFIEWYCDTADADLPDPLPGGASDELNEDAVKVKQNLRIDDDLWTRFEEKAQSLNSERGVEIRAFIAWKCGIPGAQPPSRTAMRNTVSREIRIGHKAWGKFLRSTAAADRNPDSELAKFVHWYNGEPGVAMPKRPTK